MTVHVTTRPHFTGTVLGINGDYLTVRWMNGTLQTIHHSFVEFV